MNDNKLIADFMDLETPDGVYYEYLTKEGHRSELTHFMVLEYHTSWDWLMPVANEIIKSRDEQNADWDLTQLMRALCTTNIECVYDAVVEFIKAHNKYPFNEGDDYWVLEDGDLVWGVWDDASEDMHDENPNRQYFTQEEVIDHVKTYGVKLYKQ